jgi:hypothetical protein
MGPPDAPRGRPGEKAASHKISDAAATPRPNVPPPAANAARELDAWGAAVIHLHRAGLPAAVPPFPAAWLARHGIRADWTAAA